MRQGVELSRVHAGGNDKVPRPFRCGFDKHGRFHFQKSLLVQIAAHFKRHSVTKFEICPHGIAPQVEVAIFHAQVVAPVRLVLNGKRGSGGSVQYGQFRDNQFNIARREMGILGGTFPDCPRHLNHKLAPQSVRLFAKRRIRFLIKHQLGYSVAVANIRESHPAHFAGALHPSRQCNHRPFVRKAQFAACFCSIHYIYSLTPFIYSFPDFSFCQCIPCCKPLRGLQDIQRIPFHLQSRRRIKSCNLPF
ncbi:hypothetical protein Barb7_02163 [Bacteroidales bacterium Barb7]|nr:hypothetical protein Barb7_02163 [Bacteroidales bacterium Barb7]